MVSVRVVVLFADGGDAAAVCEERIRRAAAAGERSGGGGTQAFAAENGTWAIPEHMNTLNEEEPTRYVGERAAIEGR